MSLRIVLLLAALFGLFDAGYLTYEHYSNYIPPCSTNILFADCGKVLNSPYASVYGIPLAAIGIGQYAAILLFLLAAVFLKNRTARYAAIMQSSMGFIASLYFVFLQVFIIKAICLYCLLSAIISALLFLVIQRVFVRERKYLTISVIGFMYRNITKRIFFQINPELVHSRTVLFGEHIGSAGIAKSFVRYAVKTTHPMLVQNLAGIDFQTPIGLAAGFDYEARLTQSLEPWGFGFQTVGTITNKPYGGNPRPLLGRLPQSRSLMVNKGFKNLGARDTIKSLELSDQHTKDPSPLGRGQGEGYGIPFAISIGRTNSKEPMTQKESVQDIITAFELFERSNVKHSYYELNISCPNLFGNVSFYPPKNLKELLIEVDRLHIKKPIFIKMPIEKSDKEVLEMLHIISNYSSKGVIFGNLQKDRKNPVFKAEELKKFPVGNFSGKPTFQRSNELISLTYKYYKKRFIIIGCGGVFSVEDAYEKIKRGASLVQLITGLIFQGPQLVEEINFGLEDLLAKDGFTHISQAVGMRNK